MLQVVLISGRMCTGKSGLGRRLQKEFGYHLIRTSDILKTELKRHRNKASRIALQTIAAEWDSRTKGRWILDKVR